MGKFLPLLLILFLCHLNNQALAQFSMPMPNITQTVPSQTNLDEVRGQATVKIMGIKRALNLTPAQESAWKPVERAMIDFELARLDHARELREFNQSQRNKSGGASPVERLQINSRQLRESSDQLLSIAEVLPPFLAVLDDGQKRKLYTLLPRANEIMENPVAAGQPPRLLH